MNKRILIVDDEKNIRLTLTHTLESLGATPDVAGTGAEAFQKLSEHPYGIVLLDLKLPDVDGIDVLRKIRQDYPDTRVIIVTAHGTVDNAVEAMKLGAVDFIQKPFPPMEIRALVSRVMEREQINEKEVRDYSTWLELAKKEITNRQFDAARMHVQKAVALDSSRPEAFNLLGGIMEVKGDYLRAEKYYRTAVSLDALFTPARRNLDRILNLTPEERIQPPGDRSGFMNFLSGLFGASHEKGG